MVWEYSVEYTYGWLSKFMAPFWVPIIIRHLIFRVPQKGIIILTTTHIYIYICICVAKLVWAVTGYIGTGL